MKIFENFRGKIAPNRPAVIPPVELICVFVLKVSIHQKKYSIRREAGL